MALVCAAAAQTIEFELRNWRRRPDLNRGSRFCRPLPYHLATAPIRNVRSGVSRRPFPLRSLCELQGTTFAWIEERRLERETGFEPATSTLARSHSTTELFPLFVEN